MRCVCVVRKRYVSFVRCYNIHDTQDNLREIGILFWKNKKNETNSSCIRFTYEWISVDACLWWCGRFRFVNKMITRWQCLPNGQEKFINSNLLVRFFCPLCVLILQFGLIYIDSTYVYLFITFIHMKFLECVNIVRQTMSRRQWEQLGSTAIITSHCAPFSVIIQFCALGSFFWFRLHFCTPHSVFVHSNSNIKSHSVQS